MKRSDEIALLLIWCNPSDRGGHLGLYMNETKHPACNNCTEACLQCPISCEECGWPIGLHDVDNDSVFVDGFGDVPHNEIVAWRHDEITAVLRLGGRLRSSHP